MAKKGSLNFFEVHVEKMVLGLGAAFAIFLVVYFMLGPNKVGFGGQDYGPGEIDDAIARKADRLRDAMRNPQKELDPVPDYEKRLTNSFSTPIFRVRPDEGPAFAARLPVATPFGEKMPELKGTTQVTDIKLVTPLRPTAPQMKTGISLVHRRPFDPEREVAPGEQDVPTECSWVSGGVYFPSASQENEMVTARYEGYRAKVIFAGVDVQRQEMTASGEYSDWQDVAPSRAMPRTDLPVPIIDDRTNEVRNQAELDAALDRVRKAQAVLMQPPFYEVSAGDPWSVPLLTGEPGHDEQVEPPSEGSTPPSPDEGAGDDTPGGGGDRREVRQKLREAQAALKRGEWAAARTAAEAALRNPAATATDKKRAQAIVDQVSAARQKQDRTGHAGATGGALEDDQIVRDPETNDPALWFHDDSVEPGRTYRYRVRAKLWNRYVGKPKSLADVERARDVVIVGEWSLPGEPITVAPKTHFFVKNERFGAERPTASVDVFTWHGGDWLRQTFDVEVGDAIGGVASVRERTADGGSQRVDVDFSTGAIVLDVRLNEKVWTRRATGKAEFTYSERESLVLVYLDPADGQVRERTALLDRADPLYKRLKGEASR